MSCDNIWKVDGHNISPHSLTDAEVEKALSDLEDRSSKETAYMRKCFNMFLGSVPLELARELRETISPKLPRPWHNEIAEVFHELNRREPLRRKEELLRDLQEGRLGKLVNQERIAERLFADASLTSTL